MEKKPLVMVVKDAADAAKQLNEIVEKGGCDFDFGILEEKLTHVTVNSDGTKSEKYEKRYRFTGFYNLKVGSELDSFNAVKEDMKKAKEERKALDRTLNVMNKSAFAPISIFLLIVAIITLALGILTLAKVLPLADAQIPVAIVLTVVGALSLGGSIALAILRKNKKNKLLANKDEILKQDEDLKAKEKDIDSRTPQWYKDSIWTASGNEFKNATQKHTLK